MRIRISTITLFSLGVVLLIAGYLLQDPSAGMNIQPGSVDYYFYTKDAEVLALAAERCIADLPEFAQDQNAVLTKAETRILLKNTRQESTLVKLLLPSVRRNAERYGFDLYNGADYIEAKAIEVEEVFRRKGLVN